jgi:acyl-CoA synthetase (AMP-forming)/AMP-acid ligase II/thioesterase domain-containing protein
MGGSRLAALEAIENFARSTPDSLALLEPDGLKLSYKDLREWIQMLFDRLEESGIGVGETVGVLLPPGGLHVLAVAGVMNCHVAILLLSKTTPAEVERSLCNLSASALITSEENVVEAEAAIRMGLTVLIARKGESPKDWEVRVPASSLNAHVTPAGPGAFVFSSGTTGTSKVMLWNASNINPGIESRIRSTQLTCSDRLLLMITLCNGAGIINMLTQFTAGGLIIATSGFDSSAYVSWLNRLKPTWYVCAPIVHQAALVELKREKIDRPVSLRFLESAGAPLNEEIRRELEQILGVPLLNVYGANEAQYIARETISSRSSLPMPNLAGVSCGLEIRIMDSSGMALPSGADGEIAVRGPTVVSGYVNNPESVGAAFPDGWFRTGDVGRLDLAGNLFVTGRLKEMINRGGEKIAPTEVDAVLASHPAVLEAATFAVPHPTLGEDVASAVVLRKENNAPLSSLELRRYAAERLASYKVPRRIHFVDQIPRGELGKPQRWLLAERLGKTRGTPLTPADVTEFIKSHPLAASLYQMWGRILDREDLGYDEDFFEAGGDSLAAITMLAEVDERFGSHASAQAASFIDEPTLTHLSCLIETPWPPKTGDVNSSRMQIFQVSDAGCPTRLFCFPADRFEGLPFRRMAKRLQGEMDLSIVRPANSLYRRSLFTFEYSAAEAIGLIRQAQPQGPYFLCGDCFGGIVAIEAARQLSLAGLEVRVILFDTFLPGFPRLLRNWRIWKEAIWRQWRRLWTSDHPGVRHNLRRFCRHAVWSAVVSSRRLLAAMENVPTIRRILEWAEEDYPYYRVVTLDAPILHILSSNEPSVLNPSEAASRFEWREYVQGGLEEQYVRFDHHNVFHESNLPVIVDTLLRWSKLPAKKQNAREPAQASMISDD